MATDISKSDNLMSPQLIQHKRIPPHMTFKIQDMAWDRHTFVEGLNQLMGSQICLS
jgi:hypothetical protein